MIRPGEVARLAHRLGFKRQLGLPMTPSNSKFAELADMFLLHLATWTA